jgi:type VI secretion system protein ImpC
MHTSAFQNLEATWRGISQLIENTEVARDLKIKVIDVTRAELEHDLGVSTGATKRYQDSTLFRKIQHGAPGGVPYGVLIGDFAFSHEERDVTLLRQIAKVAAVSHAPFIAAAKPELFGWREFNEIYDHAPLQRRMQRPEYANWAEFRKQTESRYVALLLPRYLVRRPYMANEYSADFRYQENLGEKEDPNLLWGNPAFVYGQVLTRAFVEHGLCTAIRGREGGGSLELPYAVLANNFLGPTEVAVTDATEHELSEQGFIALTGISGSTEAAFYSGQSCHAPFLYGSETRGSTPFEAQLPYTFMVARFTHYLRALLHRKIGTFLNRNDLESFLREWIGRYVGAKNELSLDHRFSCPLAAANVVVKDVAGAVDRYEAEVTLTPHLQLEGHSVTLRLVARVPKELIGE